MDLSYDFWYAFWLTLAIIFIPAYCTFLVWLDNNRKP